MTLQLLQFKAGIVKDITEYSANKNGPFWIDGDLVRFRNGYPTKIGGWEKDQINLVDEVYSGRMGNKEGEGHKWIGRGS